LPATACGQASLTSAVKRGANLIKITDVTGHRSLEMLKTYRINIAAAYRRAALIGAAGVVGSDCCDVPLPRTHGFCCNALGRDWH
jgi:hypothetical protein